MIVISTISLITLIALVIFIMNIAYYIITRKIPRDYLFSEMLKKGKLRNKCKYCGHSLYAHIENHCIYGDCDCYTDQ